MRFEADYPALHKTWGQRPNPLSQSAGPESAGAGGIPAERRLFKEEGDYVTQGRSIPNPKYLKLKNFGRQKSTHFGPVEKLSSVKYFAPCKLCTSKILLKYCLWT